MAANITTGFAKNLYKLGTSAVVTGGASGIGLQFVKSLICHGIKNVTIADINLKEAQKSAAEVVYQYPESNILCVKCDVTKPDDMNQMFSKTLNRFRWFDILVNNAGVMNEAKWSYMIDVNIKGMIIGTELAINYITCNPSVSEGCVVNISSVLGLHPLAGSPVYCGTKNAIIGYTRSMGMPFHQARHKVRITALCPGITATRMTESKRSISKELQEEFDILPKQDIEPIGDALITVLKTGEPGSVWMVQNNEVYQMQFDDRKTFEKKDLFRVAAV